MHHKGLFLLLMISISVSNIKAHQGLFIRFSVGSGFYTEQSTLNKSGFTTPAKNHAIGWGFHEKVAVHISDFGGLIKNEVGEYNYINLDALGLGLTYYTPFHTYLTLSGGSGIVTFAHHWWEISDAGKEKGIAINMSVNKEWFLSKRWAVGVGAQGFFFNTQNIDYEFMHFGIDGLITHYFTPVR